MIRKAVETIHGNNPLVELRPIMPDGRWWVGLYDDREKLVECILGLNAIEAMAVYWTLNRVAPSLASRVTNSVAPAKKGGCVRNADIERIRWLFLDLDSKGGSVVDLAADVRQYLAAKGWGEPVRVDSGTGEYLLYPCDLPATEHKVIRAAIKNLKARFDREGAIVDAKCANPGRIARVPGSFNRKGAPRMARIRND
jgi:hypothetical protein